MFANLCNKLEYTKESTTENIHIKSFKDINTLREGIKSFSNQYEGKSILPITYYKDVIKKIDIPSLNISFRTSMSVQGKEADHVLLVLCKKAPSLYKHQLDYRIMNVALSRARKTLTIFYLDDLLHENLIKKAKEIIPNQELFLFANCALVNKMRINKCGKLKCASKISPNI